MCGRPSVASMSCGAMVASLSLSGEEFSVANFYAPCDPGAKQQLWDSLYVKIQALWRFRVSVCGDLNAVRSIEEHRSVRGRPQSLDHLSFNRFIDDNKLIDLSLCGRKFTWFKGDGLSMSRLDIRIESLQDRLVALDENGGEEDISELELAELHGVTSDIHSLSAECKHMLTIVSFSCSVEGVAPIKHAVVSYFASHFMAANMERPGVDSLTLKRLHPSEVSSLIKPFSMVEVKAAV
ncbi:hypothetical protein TSUD_58130 [Trifolium subterraneum]|uniref:Endonuclease/exonuclease/phosphatase domain-containing protein n=1 Tax=Trifolium subterraneum TaxID=3900 RepID=A0A2Z6N4N8_TRISU|nr:hypothetical protein TSUD_58130 [Trifolium subterraneum]